MVLKKPQRLYRGDQNIDLGEAFSQGFRTSNDGYDIGRHVTYDPGGEALISTSASKDIAEKYRSNGYLYLICAGTDAGVLTIDAGKTLAANRKAVEHSCYYPQAVIDSALNEKELLVVDSIPPQNILGAWDWEDSRKFIKNPSAIDCP